MTGRRHHPLEPQLGWRDHDFLSPTPWDEIDATARAVLGLEGVAVPSIRVGLGWLLDHLDYRRHKDQVLVPRFLGRCILNSLNRAAFPVETPTDKTRLALIVHPWGFTQDLEAIERRCADLGISYVEDSPCGLSFREHPGPSSMGKFVGFSKIAPILQGAYFVSRDHGLLEAMRVRRAKANGWSWAVALGLASMRHRMMVPDYTAVGDFVYELFPPAAGGNSFLRANFNRGLLNLDIHAAGARERLTLARERLTDLLAPDANRLPCAALLPEGNAQVATAAAFHQAGFDSSCYHVDANRDLFRPEYTRAFVVPLNPRIPRNAFDGLLDRLTESKAAP